MSAYKEQAKNTRKTYLLTILFVGLVSSLLFISEIALDIPGLGFIGLGLSLAQAAVAYFSGDKIALATARAKEVEYKDAPQIHEMVTNLSKIASIPKPKIYISPDKSANAFATGRNPKNAKICLNQGILGLLDKNELEGVIAHELAHIKNRDILVMTVAMVLASLVSIITDIGFRLSFFRGGRDKENNSPIVMIVYVVAMILAPMLAFFIQMAVSRQREFLADATAVVFTRYPAGLKNALLKLYNNPVPSSAYSTSMNHFYIAPPKKKFGEKIQNLFSTHPSVQQRVEALDKM